MCPYSMSKTSWLQEFNFCHRRTWHYFLALINVCLKTLVTTQIVKAAVNYFISYAYFIDCHRRTWHYFLAWINVCLKTLVTTRRCTIVKAAVNYFISYAYFIDLIKAFTGQRNFWANIWSMHHEGKILACQKSIRVQIFHFQPSCCTN